MELEFFDDPRPFLNVAGPLLSADPVIGSLLADVSARIGRELAEGRDTWAPLGPPFARWWAVVREEGRVISAVMRTAPFAPWPTYSLPMTDEAAVLLARTLHERGEALGGTNGTLPGARILAEESARLVGGRAEITEHLRLWECTKVAVPPRPEGRLREADEADADLVLAWFRRFHEEAAEQAGREPSSEGDQVTRDAILARIRDGGQWLWEEPDGALTHLTGVNPPSYGVARVGPVFTPREHRGRGVASYAVAEVTRRGLEAGRRMCLFTDQANPTSNKIYAALGYAPVVDMAVYRIVGDIGADG